ncbi:MAG: CHASE2 domain-containing protein [Treponema sp.]|jgi:adenylate cyclase|nr:CHASE2 domain-containing protein [Treponema sp.]
MNFRRRSFFIALAAVVLFSVVDLAGTFTMIENRVRDNFLRFRPQRERLDTVVFLEVDDEATIHVGVFPWPRSVMADGLLRLKEYGVSHAIFDIEYIDKSPPGVDAVYLEQGLPGDFSQSFSGINATIRDLIGALSEGRLSGSGAAQFGDLISDFIVEEEQALLEKARGIARDNDEYFAQALALFGKGWVTVNLQSRALSGEQAERRPLAEQKFSYPLSVKGNLRADLADSGLPYVDLLSPIPPVIEAAQGAGFTNTFVDKDGVRRRIFLTRNVQDHWYVQLVVAPLLDYLGGPELIEEPGRLTLKGAQVPGKAPRDIVIPLDTQGAMLLDWPLTSYRDSFTHLSFAELFFLETDETLMEQYISNLAAADLAFFAQFDDAVAAAYTLLYGIQESLAAAALARSRALAETSDSAFADYLDLKAGGRRLTQELLSLDAGERVGALAEALAWDYPGEAESLYGAAAYIQTNLSYLRTVVLGIEERELWLHEALAGKMCILGRVDTGSTDFGVNPFWEKYENPGTNAVILDTILAGSFIVPLHPLWSAALGLLLVPLLVLLLSPLKPALRSTLGLGAALVMPALAFGLFAATGLSVGILSPSLAMILAVIIREIVAYISSEQEKQFIRKAFSTYLSGDVVQEIIADPSRLQLGGLKRYMTAVFSDIQGFSGISERLDPEQLVRLLNQYLSGMSNIILDERGTIDKYVGDAIIAFFGAPLALPDHGLRACVSAVMMKRLEADLNRQFIENNMSPLPLLTRIGINTGDMVVGNMGTDQKMNYTIMGNEVNLAARLEGVNKQYGTWILASDETVNATAGQVLSRRLDRVRVVGITKPVQLYEILELTADANSELREKVNLFHQALTFFEAQDWNRALILFARVLDTYPDDNPSLVYLKRCQTYRLSPPAKDWDGVFNLNEK